MAAHHVATTHEEARRAVKELVETIQVRTRVYIEIYVSQIVIVFSSLYLNTCNATQMILSDIKQRLLTIFLGKIVLIISFALCFTAKPADIDPNKSS